MKDNENLRKIFPFSIGTRAILRGSGNNMTLPLNKVIRFIAEGEEHNIQFYVSLH
jgi:hypothetical protein